MLYGMYGGIGHGITTECLDPGLRSMGLRGLSGVYGRDGRGSVRCFGQE